MGEITLRDGLVVAAASVGARLKQALIIEREILPGGWKDSAVDLVVSRSKRHKKKQKQIVIGSTELKWWRQSDASNSSNRRKDLIKDFLRAAAIYPEVESFSFVALLATTNSWNSTAITAGSDKDVMDLVNSTGTEKWNVTKLKASKSLGNAVRSIKGRVPVVNVFHTQLLSEFQVTTPVGITCFARVWSVRKPQKSVELDTSKIDSLFPSKAS